MLSTRVDGGHGRARWGVGTLRGGWVKAVGRLPQTSRAAASPVY
jgi:hypothetical protein